MTGLILLVCVELSVKHMERRLLRCKSLACRLVGLHRALTPYSDSSDISTVPQISTSWYEHMGARSLTFIKQSPSLLNFDYFNNCSTRTILPIFDSSTYNPDMTWQGTPPCHPVLAIPTKILDIQSAWASASCTDVLGGFYDPPIAMQPVPALLPGHITAKPVALPPVTYLIPSTTKTADPQSTPVSAQPASEKPQGPTAGPVAIQGDPQNAVPSGIQIVDPVKPNPTSTSNDPASQHIYISGGDVSSPAIVVPGKYPLEPPSVGSGIHSIAITTAPLTSSNSVASIVNSFVAALEAKPSSRASNVLIQPSDALVGSPDPSQSASAVDPIAGFVMSAFGGKVSITAVSTTAAVSSSGKQTQGLLSDAIYTAGSLTYTASHSGGKLVLGALTITPGGPAMTLSGHTFSAATSGVMVDGSSIQFSALPTSDPKAGTANGAVFSVGASTFTARKDPSVNDVAIGSKTISLGGPAATVNGAVVSLGSNGVVVGGSMTVPLSNIDVTTQSTTGVLTYNASSDSVISGMSRCIGVFAMLTSIYLSLQRFPG